jgi:hypothetical protein
VRALIVDRIDLAVDIAHQDWIYTLRVHARPPHITASVDRQKSWRLVRSSRKQPDWKLLVVLSYKVRAVNPCMRTMGNNASWPRMRRISRRAESARPGWPWPRLRARSVPCARRRP